jgi:Rieske 2Fe-2S family protein
MIDVSFDNDESFGADRYFVRYPLLKGHVTGSRDGKPVAPLLGSVKDYDGGATDFQIGVISYGLAYCDHVVLYRFIPMSKDMTDCEVIWLVRADAEEGKDYKLDDLTWLWDVTTIADKRIIQDNSRGVESRFYEPGPFTPMEHYAQKFTEWYLNVLNA